MSTSRRWTGPFPPRRPATYSVSLVSFGRGLRAVPARPLRRAAPVLPGGRRGHDRVPRRRAGRRRLRGDRGGRARDGASRSAERAGERRRQAVRGDPRGVRGHPRSDHRRGIGRRQVSQGRRRDLDRPLRRDAPGEDGLEPITPRGGEPGRRGDGARTPGERLEGASRHLARSYRCSSMGTRRWPAKVSSRRRSTSRGSTVTRPVAPCISSSTTRSALRPLRARHDRADTRPTSPRWSKRRCCT